MLGVVLVVVERAIRLTTVVFIDMACTAAMVKTKVNRGKKRQDPDTYDIRSEDNRSHRCAFRDNV